MTPREQALERRVGDLEAQVRRMLDLVAPLLVAQLHAQQRDRLTMEVR
jgi:hypothetical protein